MRIKMAFAWNNGTKTFPQGSVIEVDEGTGTTLIAEGHTRVSDQTPCRIDPTIYAEGQCVPTTVNTTSDQIKAEVVVKKK